MRATAQSHAGFRVTFSRSFRFEVYCAASTLRSTSPLHGRGAGFKVYCAASFGRSADSPPAGRRPGRARQYGRGGGSGVGGGILAVPSGADGAGGA